MEIGAEVILKATKVDGIYEADPMIHKKAKKFDELTYLDVLKKQLKVMDATAISLCMDHRNPHHRLQFEEEGEYQADRSGRKSGDESERISDG